MSKSERDVRSLFRVRAEIYDDRKSMLYKIGLAWFAWGALCAWFLKDVSTLPFEPPNHEVAIALVVFMVGLAGVGLAWRYWLPKLTCPHCAARMDNVFPVFCPECGEDQVENGARHRMTCRACNKELWDNEGRSYKIRYCPDCGAHVHDNGV